MEALRKYSKLEKLLSLLRHNIIFAIGTLLLTYKSIFLNCVLGLEINIFVVFYSITASLLIMSPTINHKNKFGLIYLNIVYLIATIIIYANYLYYDYSTNFISFYQIRNLKYVKEIGGGLITLINVKNILMFFLDNVLVAILSIIFAKKIMNMSRYPKKIFKLTLKTGILVLNILAVLLSVDFIYNEKSYNKSLIVKTASIYYYQVEDAKDYVYSLFAKEDVDEEKLKEIYAKNINEKQRNEEYTNIAQDKNVVIVQLESLNQYIIGKTINGKEITPNLNKFFKDNIYCTNMYNQGLGSTADSEFEMENSMYPLENGYAFQKYYDNTWLDIYTTLRSNGYYTSFMHPNTSTFWNRSEVYNVGYNIDEYDDINAFDNLEHVGEFYSDADFFEQAVDKMEKYQGKFCTTLVTVTTHIPFGLDGASNLEEKLTIAEEDLSGYDNWIFRNYIRACNFTDYAFGKFIQKMEETGLMDNTIIIAYGDHGAGIAYTKDIKRLYEENGTEYTEFDKLFNDVHVPFGIKIPGVEDEKNIETAVSKIDIKPTILQLLGIEDNYSMGNSIFSNLDYSFIKGLGFVTSKNYCINDKYYDRNTLEEIEETEELKTLLEKMIDEIYLSDTIIKNNLFSNVTN